MSESASVCEVVVVGPADLTTTAVVDVLRGQGIDVSRSVEADRLADSASPGIAIVDVTTHENAMRMVTAALDSGWWVVVLSEDESVASAAAAVAYGAAAWLSTRVPVRELVDIVRRLRSGCQVMSDGDRAAWQERYERNVEEAEERVSRLDKLTDREFGVLRSLEKGLRAADIADINVVALTTVRTQIRSILQKLKVNSQDAAISMYRAALRARNDR